MMKHHCSRVNLWWAWTRLQPVSYPQKKHVLTLLFPTTTQQSMNPNNLKRNMCSSVGDSKARPLGLKPVTNWHRSRGSRIAYLETSLSISFVSSSSLLWYSSHGGASDRTDRWHIIEEKRLEEKRREAVKREAVRREAVRREAVRREAVRREQKRREQNRTEQKRL